MVDYLELYARLLRQGAAVYDELIALYLPDKRSEEDWAAITVSEAITKRNGMLERLAHLPTKLSAEDTGPLIQSIVHFIDSHWADYRQFPMPDPGKQLAVEQLHSKLKTVMDGIGNIHNAVRTPALSK